MKKEDIKKVVLAYSGGLDTSVIIPWLKDNYNNCEVIAVCADLGQGDELDPVYDKALNTGASNASFSTSKKNSLPTMYGLPLKLALYMKRNTCWALPLLVR